ncbi:UDP-3-O-(3-hydroxymyristoyl)glucosamine N-acyltransferase [Wenzhouxiangella limi]|uniref:UDP-3-O-acylglucosamine N-acyltransferase n=1 Tax=Wenzhouxiangella limi TaxID=2707351 RepID=A0A845V4Q7_9GAMM|nr:UDP-3-O-(3-hydroxymyristoyl)glucosamine N-acyltransferase [Wenzhouxiangella limi]NDY94935.1 UDP-3-O-(3-hydroxymyristoyl)glucosamine N-acyltransferase [Wenzhouxiangella limi]
MQTATRTFRLEELAGALGLAFTGNPDCSIRDVGTLDSADPDAATFLANPAYKPALASTRAGVVVMKPDMAETFNGNALLSANPYADWARLIELLRPQPAAAAGIHPSAVIADDAQIDDSAHIGAQVAVGAGVRIEARAVIGPACVIDDGVCIGESARLVGRVYVGGGAHLGRRVIVHPGVVIGADGFGLAMEQGGWRKVPQVGSVRIGDDCEIGANTTIDRGAIEDTVLEHDVRVDNQVQIAHNVHIGAHTAIAGCVGIAGSTRIGRYCMIAGASGIAGHLDICDSVIITAMSTVLDSIDQPGEYGSGIPARPHARWKRLLVRLGQLDEWARRLRRLEQSNNNGPSRHE